MSWFVGHVDALWRYPVKSLGGQRLSEAWCTRRGMLEDRRWAVRGADGKIGSGKTTRRFRRMPGLLALTAEVDDSGVTWIRFPDGSTGRAEDALTAQRVSAVVHEEVTLVMEEATSHFDAAPLHLLTTSSLEWLASRRPHDGIEQRRFRPNVVIAGAQGRTPEDDWLGRLLRVADTVIAVDGQTERCVMTTMTQPGLRFAPRVLTELRTESATCFGVYGTVVREGRLRVGDAVEIG